MCGFFLPNRLRHSQELREKNGGSAWESNPPATSKTRRPTVLKTAGETSQGTNSQAVSEPAEIDLADCLALLKRESPELASIVEAWETLPEAVRRGILAMVEWRSS